MRFDHKGFKKYKDWIFFKKRSFKLYFLSMINVIEEENTRYTLTSANMESFDERKIYYKSDDGRTIYTFVDESNQRSLLGWLFSLPLYLAFWPIIIAFQLAAIIVTLPIAILYNIKI